MPARFPDCWRSRLVAVAMLAVAPSPEHRAAAPRAETPTAAHRSGARHLQHRSRHLRRAGEPLLRLLLRHVPRRRWHPGRRVCLPDPEGAHGAAARITTRTSSIAAGPHNERASRLTIDKGQDGRRGPWRFGRSGTRAGSTRRRPGCEQAMPGPNGTPDVMGYHTAHEIPNYWTYAQRFTLAGPDVRAERLVDVARAPVPGVGLVRDVSQPRPDAVPIRPEVPRIQRRRRREVLGAGRRQAPAVRLGRYHVAAPQPRRELGVLRRARTAASGRRAASRPRRARTRS